MSEGYREGQTVTGHVVEPNKDSDDKDPIIQTQQNGSNLVVGDLRSTEVEEGEYIKAVVDKCMDRVAFGRTIDQEDAEDSRDKLQKAVDLLQSYRKDVDNQPKSSPVQERLEDAEMDADMTKEEMLQELTDSGVLQDVDVTRHGGNPKTLRRSGLYLLYKAATKGETR